MSKDVLKVPGQIMATENASRALDILVHNHLVKVAKRRAENPDRPTPFKLIYGY